MDSQLSVEKFVFKTLSLLEKERSAEIEESKVLTEKLPPKELQRRGVCLLKLHIGSRKTGMFGRTVINFETHLDALPSHSFSPGDIIGLNQSTDSQSEGLGSGIVTKVTQTAVSAAFEESQDLYSLDDGQHDYYKLTKLANDVTYKRLKRTLNSLHKVTHEVCSMLVAVLFGEQPLSPELNIPDLHYINPGLDESQRDAVRFALAQKELAVIHGPPGTGKTTTVIELILQAVQLGNKILACAPSNIAVDNLVERLVKSKHKIVRLGHPARLLPHIQKYSLDAILANSEETRLVEDVRRDLDKALSGLKKAKNSGERQKIREDMKHLRKELRQREVTATREILKRADVVLVTLTSATDDGPMKLLEESHFDITVIDEVSQAMEAACWIPLLRSRKCILAGDHLQLPPTILSTEAAKAGLEVTLMERVLGLYGDAVMRMLTTQYRMHEKIMQWSSTQLYDNKLTAHDSVKHHLLRDLSGVTEDEVSVLPLLFIDTAGCDLYELDLLEEISKGNEGEADVVRQHVERLIQSGVKPEDIAVIAPYNLQVELIRLRLAKTYPKIEVKSVDGFQGREKEAVIISLVRSNKKGEVGFLSERRRINVAVTRARRHLAVIGDSVTVSSDNFLRSLIEYLANEAEVHTAQQYMDDGLLGADNVSRPEHLDDLLSMAKHNNTGARPKSQKQQANNKKPQSASRKEHTQGRQKQATANQKQDEIDMEEDRVKELQSQLTEFQANKEQTQLDFPKTLSGRDRFLVHELAEKLGLIHSSKGTGDDRYIAVSKPGARNTSTPYDKAVKLSDDTNDTADTTGANTTGAADDDDNGGRDGASKKKRKKKKKKVAETEEIVDGGRDLLDEPVEESDKVIADPDDLDKENKGEKSVREESEDVKPIGQVSDGKIRCNSCGKDVIKANIQLHEIHCARKMKESQSKTDDINKAKVKEVSKSSKHRKYDKELADKVENVDKDDIDALIATVQSVDNFCCFKKCKTSVQTLFQQCQFCDGRYCMSHYVPEVHGCGDAARAEARARISKDGVLYRGSGAPDKRPDSAKKAHLQRKLDSKLTELSAKRKGKPKK